MPDDKKPCLYLTPGSPSWTELGHTTTQYGWEQCETMKRCAPVQAWAVPANITRVSQAPREPSLVSNLPSVWIWKLAQRFLYNRFTQGESQACGLTVPHHDMPMTALSSPTMVSPEGKWWRETLPATEMWAGHLAAYFTCKERLELLYKNSQGQC